MVDVDDYAHREVVLGVCLFGFAEFSRTYLDGSVVFLLCECDRVGNSGEWEWRDKEAIFIHLILKGVSV